MLELRIAARNPAKPLISGAVRNSNPDRDALATDP